MLDKYPHVTQQQACPWRWKNVDALYTFTDRIPAWVVDDDVMAIWASGEQGFPNSYMNWDSKHTEAGMALMLSRVPSCLGAGDLEGKKVYSTIVVFVHPRQELLTIKEGAQSLLEFAGQPNADVTILCELPGHKYGKFYPSAINHAYLVLPYCGEKGKPKQLRLDLAVCYNRCLLVHRLHQWKGKLGDLALLPPVFSTDPTLPILLPVRHIGELWINGIYAMPFPAGGAGMGAVCPSISRLTCCRQEVIAGKILADWTEDKCVVYPGPPNLPTPKDDEADRQDVDPISLRKGSGRSNVKDHGNKGSDAEDGSRNKHSDELADDDEKSEHGGGSGEDATSKKEEDEGSEGESDDQSKTPKDQTAVSNDSGLGASGSGGSVGVGAKAVAVVSNPGVNLSTGLPLPTQLPSMDLLESLADDLYAYSGELLQGLEEMSMAMLDRVLSGFKKSGGHTREYIYETAAIAINFFSRAGDMEMELESSEALKFWEAVDGMKESIRDLIRQTASAEETYEDAAANFDNILASVLDELKEYVALQGKKQCKTYIVKCLEQVRGVQGSLDSTQFIPMIISNLTTHHALALNQRVNQSQIPLQIMILPMRTQAASMGAGLKFIEFLSRWVLALDVKLGLTSSVSIESGGEGSGVQSTSGEGGKTTAKVASPSTSPKKHDASKTPSTGHTPPTADHTYGTCKASKTPDAPAKPKMMFSPKATASLAKFRGMSDDDEGTSLTARKRRGRSTD